MEDNEKDDDNKEGINNLMEWANDWQMEFNVDKRKRGDLMQAYRVFSGVDDVDPSIWFNMDKPREGEVTTRQRRGHLNVKRGEGKGDLRKNFWSQRVIDPWNGLPNQVQAGRIPGCFQKWNRQSAV